MGDDAGNLDLQNGVKQNLHSSTTGTLDTTSPCQVNFMADDGAGQGTCLHFNERGMLVNCDQPLKLNTKVRMILRFPGLRNAVEVSGEVVWTNIYGPNEPLSPRGMGIKFMNLERDTERLLADLAGQYEVLASVYSCYYT